VAIVFLGVSGHKIMSTFQMHFSYTVFSHSNTRLIWAFNRVAEFKVQKLSPRRLYARRVRERFKQTFSHNDAQKGRDLFAKIADQL
jgi:hypothetical protein